VKVVRTELRHILDLRRPDEFAQHLSRSRHLIVALPLGSMGRVAASEIAVETFCFQKLLIKYGPKSVREAV
jgi:hypothetical protein